MGTTTVIVRVQKKEQVDECVCYKAIVQTDVQMMFTVKPRFSPPLSSHLRGQVAHAPLCGDVGDPCTNGLCAAAKK